MIKYFRRGLMVVAASLSIGVLGVSAVGAQSNGNQAANGFKVSPVRSELIIDKGKSSTITVTIENPTAIPTNAQAVVNDFVSSDDESGTPRLILDDAAKSPKNSFKSLVAPIDSVSLAPKEKKDIQVKISVPQDANSGGYYGAVRFVPVIDGQTSNVGLTASVGTIVLVTVPGDLKESAELVQLSAEQNKKATGFITSGNVSVLTRIKNTGDIHIKPFGRVEVKNTFGKSVESFEINNTEPRANILPDSTRRFDNELKNKNWFGRYTIEANLGYSQGSGSLISAKSVFWYIPMWAIYVFIGLVVSLAVGIYILVRRSKNKKRSHRK